MVFFQEKSYRFYVILEMVMYMIDYIRKTVDNRLMIVSENTVVILETTFQKFFNSALKRQLTNLQAREQVTRTLFGFTAKVPLYLDSQHIFLCIRSYRSTKTLYVNLFSIATHHKVSTGVAVLFHGEHELVVGQAYAFLSQLEKARMVRDFLADEKVFSYI